MEGGNANMDDETDNPAKKNKSKANLNFDRFKPNREQKHNCPDRMVFDLHAGKCIKKSDKEVEWADAAPTSWSSW